jgi:uncharacterized surface anchored protein
MTRLQKLATGVAVVLCLNPLVFSQGGATGAITGTIQDSSGGVLAGAKIEVISEATNQVVRQLTSDSSGLFTAPLLPVGNYTVQVSAAGFASIGTPRLVQFSLKYSF